MLLRPRFHLAIQGILMLKATSKGGKPRIFCPGRVSQYVTKGLPLALGKNRDCTPAVCPSAAVDAVRGGRRSLRAVAKRGNGGVVHQNIETHGADHTGD